jgi:AraC-like DNA-binding protein
VVSALNFAFTGHVCEVPYRAVAVALSPGLLAGVLQVACLPAVQEAPEFMVGTASPQVLDAMCRLVRLLDHPDDRAVLAGAAERELLYRVLQTDAGQALRQMALDGHLVSRVEPTIRWIRERVMDPIDVEELAEMSHVSTSSLYRHFKAATGSTPLQFQKRLRLQEARKLLLVGETNAAGAAARVGYQNPAQFNREYARLFGTTPGREAAKSSRSPASPSAPPTRVAPVAAPGPEHSSAISPLRGPSRP